LPPSPVRTAALRAAHRANAQKSTDPVTAPGEARVAWNGLPHGGRTDRLPEKLLGAAGDREGQALYRWFQAEITATLGRGRPQEERWADPIAVGAWCRGREVVCLRAKPECPLVSWALCSRLHLLSRIQVEDGRRRMGLAFWVQTTSLRDPARREQVGVRQGEDLLGTPPRGSWLEQLLAPAALPLPPAQPLGACPISRDCWCHPTSRISNARTDAGNHARPRAPAFTSRHKRVRHRRCFLSV
jgi:hypothetical protein